MSKISSLVLYNGPSLIDGKPIIAVATGLANKSDNPKTGDAIQTWIMRKDVHPMDALKTGADFSVCGHCIHRHLRSCYVNIAQAPRNVWGSYHRGIYQDYQVGMLDLFRDRVLRIGSYGEPTAVPEIIWRRLITVSSGWMGYTHRWRSCLPVYKDFCMASCDSLKDSQEAQNRGWRTFRVRVPGEKVAKNEFICPASKEAGKKVQCNKCQACRGVTGNISKNPVIFAHGTNWKELNYIKGIKKYKNHEKYATALCGCT